MRKIKIHDGKLAIDVKNLELPQYPDYWFEDGWFVNYDPEETLLKNELLGKIEKTLNEFYPELHCEVNVAGRSGGWIELEGFWSVEEVSNRFCLYSDNLGNYYEIQTEHDLIYDCIEMFEFLVNASIGIWFQFWQNIIDRIWEEGEE